MIAKNNDILVKKIKHVYKKEKELPEKKIDQEGQNKSLSPMSQLIGKHHYKYTEGKTNETRDKNAFKTIQI